ncbi:sensor histidine kinase [Microvirga subterranea]|uniref:histidine kinase n=1 Tax=Microvirga subterranea TaxID=186651 RepID=A0A370HNU4_9HYPH|nr:ATP-binding protein [Microvirga subterranea]RDI60010.1 phospho-acceptor domain-containing protein [Microvirga subterranea]
MIDKQGNVPLLLSTIPPNRSQRRLAGWVLAILVIALVVTAPFSRIRLAETAPLLLAYAAAVLFVEVLTAALLLSLFAIQKSRAVLVLSAGYLFSGLLVIPWALTFPGIFTAFGLDAGLQSTAAIAAVRRLSFPVFVLAYAALKDQEDLALWPRASIRTVIAAQVLLIAGLAAGLTWTIIQADQLPTFMVDARDVAPLWRYVPAAAIGLYLVGLVVLWLRRQSTLDLWLMIVLCTLVIEIALLSYLGGGARLSVGWWAGRLYGLASASMVLLVLLSETATLQARLARSIHSERLARESRLTAMEALSASIAHEISQPLASMVTNANAGLRWLDKEIPRIVEAQAALERVVRDGHRARDVVDGIRQLFRKGTQDRTSVDMNSLIKDVLRRSADEARFGRVSVESDLDPNLPLATGSPLQLQQVISNLVANAVDATSAVTGRPRIVRIITRLRASREILVSVEDSGPGIADTLKDRIFEPFFSTKPDGMGMGLMFSRSVVESHGGKLWVEDTVTSGAIFRFTLPCSDWTGASDTELRQ